MYAKSYALSHFAREEFGKTSMLMRTAIEVAMEIEVDWSKLRKRFRSHRSKITNDGVLSLLLFGRIEVDGKKLNPNVFLSTTNQKNNKKNQSLYMDWDDNKFMSPRETITRKESSRNLSLAKYRIALLSPLIANFAEKLHSNSDPWYTTKKLSIFASSDGIAENPPQHAGNGLEREGRMTGFLPYRRKIFDCTPVRTA